MVDESYPEKPFHRQGAKNAKIGMEYSSVRLEDVKTPNGVLALLVFGTRILFPLATLAPWRFKIVSNSS
jgi:hypothetical protein